MANDAATADQSRTISECGFVYFIRLGRDAHVKVGWTDNVHRRLITLQTGHYQSYWVELAIPGGRDFERQLHKRFTADHIRGEWYLPGDDFKAFIAEGRKIHSDLLAEFCPPPLTEEEAAQILARLAGRV